MKTSDDDLIENINSFSDEHLYALLGGSIETGRVAPQSGHVLAERGKAFFHLFLKKFRGAICEKDGLRDQIVKIGGLQSQKALVPVMTGWVMARGGANVGSELTQVAAIYLAVLLSRVTLDALCHGYHAE